MPRRPHIVQTRLTDAERVALAVAAAQAGETVSFVLRQALREYLHRWRPRPPTVATTRHTHQELQ